MRFTQLIATAEEVLSPARVEAISAASDLPSGGADTAVVNYPHKEAVILVRAFSAASGTLV